MKFPIVEIFTSIQGEGVNLGKAANFVRFAGCNLNCPWCDTEWRKANEALTVDEILSRLDKKVKIVVLTGGEPLMQKELPWLTMALQGEGYLVTIETNGTYATTMLPDRAKIHITCSPKPERDWQINPNCFFDELKYVVDGKLTADKIRATTKPIWLQPEGGNMQEAWKEAIKLQKEMLATMPYLDIRIGVQLHKIMEVR